MSKLDKRGIRMCGKYESRAALIAACEKYVTEGATNYMISLKVGVSTATVSRLLNGDPMTTKPKYRAEEHVSELRLDDYWTVQDSPNIFAPREWDTA